MAAPITRINPSGINTTGDYVVNSISSTGNVTAGNVKTDHLLHANGDPYVFTSNAAGTNTQVQFNDANNFAGSANLTFNKTTGTLTADFFVGNGSQLTGLPASYTDTNANSAIDARVTKSFIDNLNVDADTLDGLSSLDFATAAQGTKADSALQAADLSGYATESYVGNAVANLVNSAPGILDTLGELANAIGNDASFTTTITNQLANKANTADLSTVALTGNYADLNNKPTLFDGTYANLTGKPTLFDGEYASLANKPTLFSGSYADLTNKPTLFDGTYANLTGKPTLSTVASSGSYTDLIDKPTLFSGSYTDLTNKPTLFDGEYSSLANKPTLFDGTYANLTGKPTLGTAAATNANAYATAAQGSKADTALQPSDLTGYATETYVTNAIANIPNPASVTVSSTAPASPIEGDLWLDSDTGEMSIYFGNAWVAPTTSVSTALTVTDNAQPNITSVGTLTGLTVNGNITANYFIGNGSQLTGLPASYTDTDANAAIDARVTKTFVDNLGVNANTLNGHADTYFATSTQGSLADSAVQPGDLATVATSGSYTDLLNKPTLFDGTYANLTGKPTLFDGEYASLANKPSLFSGSYTDLSDKPTLFSGAYGDLTGKPTLANVATSGSYTDLIDKPSLFDGEYASLANKPTLFSGSYVDLTNKPTLGTAAATDSTDYATAAQGAKADTALQPSDLTGYATESYVGNTITNLINAAPGSLDTLGELANALGNDANYSTTITTALAGKLSTSAFASTADTWLGTKSTSDVSEGTNLYYTVTRANSAIDARVTKTFVDNLNINANTLNGHADTYFATSTQGTKADTAVQPGDLATVATTGSYSDLTGKPTLFDGTYANLTGKPTLGTAAATNSTDYATAAQGAKADTALQSVDLSGYATETYVTNAIANIPETASVVVSSNAPSTPIEGDLWLDSDTGEMSIYFGGAWVAPTTSVSTALTVTDNAQPNITSVGTLTGLTVNGNVTANYFIGNGSQLTGLPAGYTDTNANSAIDARVTKSFVDNLGVNANTLNGHSDTYFATSTQGTKADTAVQPGDLATVATSGSYTDLIDKPSLFDGTYANLTGKPTLSTVATSGSYSDLLDIPTLFDGEYSSLANKPSLFDGTYANLTGKPTLGTAAATNANAYATAAQGLLADSAIQSGANISVFTNDSGYLVAANLTGYATESYVGNAVANLVASAPAALDTLNELANALGNDASYSTTITNALANKLSTSSFTSTADTWLATKTTSNLSEGTNQYYTDTRANTAIDNRVTKTFVDNLAVVANIANIAYSVAVANITGIGNIATINKDGNSSNVLYGNGVFASAPVTYANSNVESYLPTYTGDLSPGNITIATGNLKLTGGTADYVLSTDGAGNLSWVQQSSGSSGGESTVTSVDSFTGDGTTTTYTLSVTPQNINQTFINYNGALQLRSSYSLDGANVIFTEAPADGSEFEVTTQMNVTSGSGNLTVRNYTADGVQTDYAVSAGVNATNILVTENGLLQTPAVDYDVTGSTLTFTTAPGNGVKIQIRELGVAVATITPVGSNTQVLFNDVGNFGNSSQFTFSKSSNTLTVGNLTVSSSVVGNLVPSANVTYNLGSATNRWKDLYLSGNTIDLAGAQLKTDTSGAVLLVPAPTVATPNPTALLVTATGGITTVQSTAGLVSANTISTAIAATATTGISTKKSFFLNQTGNLTVYTGTARWYAPGNVNISSVTARLINSADADVGITINKHLGSDGSVTTSNVTITSGTVKSSGNLNITMIEDDYLTVDVTSIGFANVGSDLNLTFIYNDT